MSTAGIVAIAVGGTVVLFGAIAVLLIWLQRSYEAGEQKVLGRLREELPRRGWTFEERNDAYVSVFNELPPQPFLALEHPLAPKPKATAARNIITGQHRGRSFLAAEFDVYSYHRRLSNPQRCIWVRTPAPRPGLVVKKVIGPQNAINRAVGWDYATLGDPEFDKRFEVSTDDHRFAHDVLHTRMMRFLLDEPRRFQEFRLVGDVIDVSDQITDHRDPVALIPALDLRCDILDLVPQAVWA